MTKQPLKNVAVAILVTDGFEQVELIKPRQALDAAGATTHIVAPKGGSVRGWNHTDWGDDVKVDIELAHARPDNYAALLLPGGVMNPDALRMNVKAVAFVRAFFDAGKPIASICHGPWTILEAGGVRCRRMTSWPSLRTDLRNGGVNWVDEEVVVDRNLVTSRKPEDIPAFNREMVGLFQTASKVAN